MEALNGREGLEARVGHVTDTIMRLLSYATVVGHICLTSAQTFLQVECVCFLQESWPNKGIFSLFVFCCYWFCF